MAEIVATNLDALGKRIGPMISAAYDRTGKLLVGQTMKVYENEPEDGSKRIDPEISVGISGALAMISDILIAETGRFVESGQHQLLSALDSLSDEMKLMASPKAPGNCISYILFGLEADGVRSQHEIACGVGSASYQDALVMQASYRKIYAVMLHKHNDGCFDPKDPGKAWLTIGLKEIAKPLMDDLMQDIAERTAKI